VRVYL